VQKNQAKVNLFNHYNVVVFAVFITLTLFAIAIAAYRYQYELELHLTADYVELAEQGDVLNQSFSTSANTLQGLKQFAQYYLENTEIQANIPLDLHQQRHNFHLNVPERDIIHQGKRLQSNITGIGNIAEFSADYWQELKMAYSLTPAFVTANANNDDATWFYYLSDRQFVSIYPWISHNAWQFSAQMNENPFFVDIKSSDPNLPFVWSSPFMDTAGKGIKASIGTGVYLNNEFKGALVIDVDLASLKDRLSPITEPEHGHVLLNAEGDVVLYKNNTLHPMSKNLLWQNVAPASLKSFSKKELLALDSSAVINDFLVQTYQLSSNKWVLVKYQAYSNFTAPLLIQFLSIFGLFFVGLVTFLTLVFVITRRSFVKPSIQFIAHIEHCSQGDPGKVKPNKDWLPWFQIVENIFGENRSLLQQLKEQNVELDLRVAEKTQALIESSEQHHRDYVLLRSVINAIPEFIIFNDNEANLIGCNKSFEQYICMQESQLLEKPVKTLLPFPLARAFSEFSALPYDQSQKGFKQTVETAQSTFDVFCTRFYNDAGKSLGSISIIRDVSEQYAIQSALEQAKNQAELASQAKSQFLANMSHEIRTPINAIKGMMGLLETTALTAFQQQYLANAQGASGALLHLIDDLLDLSRIEAGKLSLNLRETRLDHIIHQALQLNIINANQKGLSLTVDVEHDAPIAIHTDEKRLVQVLANLLNNAVKFTEHGSITLSVTAIAKDSAHSMLKFKVKDTGIGIAQEKRERLFDAFSQADSSMTREYGGSGLGLSICQQIVNLLGGEIVIKSELNLGSEFSFVIPVQTQHASAGLDANNEVQLLTLGHRLPDEVRAFAHDLNWQYHGLDTCEQLHTYKAKQQAQQPAVLLIDEDFLCQHSSISLKAIEQDHPNICLFGICQSLTVSVDPSCQIKFDHLSTPYLLIEKPLFRYTLLNIHQYLANNDMNAKLTSRDENADNVQVNAQVNAQSLPKEPLLDVVDASAKRNGAIEPSFSQSMLAGSLNGLTVLLVEDNLVNQMVAKELLISMGAAVDIAENGQIALDYLAINVVDVVLMDIQMPVMDGLTATREIRKLEHLHTLPIIAMTAHARLEDKQASLAAGMNLHVAKPVSAQLLSQSIVDVVKRNGSQNLSSPE